MKQSLAVKYRPKIFEDVYGQDVIITILKKQLESRSFKNCYLFCGSSGCGKTTVARIFANEINNHEGSPIEIDAASNNGVDNVKNIISSAKERSLDSEYKIYIIDECHSITNQGWQAFLKCIEEPPAYTIFIFCTTDPQKMPATILNRCMRFNFSKIKPALIEERLATICNLESIENYKDSIEIISKSSNGQLRDAIANLEKVVDYDRSLDAEKTLFILGRYSYIKLVALMNNLIDGNESEVIKSLEDSSSEISDWKYFSDLLLTFCLDVYKYCVLKEIRATEIPSVYESELIRLTNFNDANKYYGYVTRRLLELKNMVKSDNYPYNSIQAILLQIARCE